MNQLLEHAPQYPAYPEPDPDFDAEYARLVDQVNGRFDPLFGIRMPSPNDDYKSPIMDATARDLGFVWEPKYTAPRTLPPRSAAGALASPASAPKPADKIHYDTSYETLERVLSGLRNLGNPEPQPRPSEQPTTTLPPVREKASWSSDEVLDRKFESFVNTHTETERHPKRPHPTSGPRHRMERQPSMLRRWGQRLGALCLSSGVAFAAMEYFANRGH